MTTNHLSGARREPGTPKIGKHLPKVEDISNQQVQEELTIRQLAVTLGSLRQASPGFQDALQARLVGRLADVPRPWWRRALTTVQPTVGRVPMSRRAMLGAAAAGALSLFAISLAVPITGQPPQVSAREILEKVQAASDNPLLAGVKSFHLVATSTSSRRDGTPVTVTTEQWFVAPNKMRTETRSTQPDGSTARSGFVHDGSRVRHYTSGNAPDAMVVGVFVAPVGAPFGKEPPPDLPAGSPPLLPAPGRPIDGPAQPAGPIVITPAVGKPEGGEDRVTRGQRTVHEGDGPGKPEPADILVARDETNANPDGRIDEGRVTVTAMSCPEPRRTGEATIAGRPVFVVEADMSRCMPEGAPDELRGRHVRWVDQKSFLPLKMEMYGRNGSLMDRYEVTSIEYDGSIADSSFTQLPPGTTVHEPRLLPPPDGVGPGVLPASPPAPPTR